MAVSKKKVQRTFTKDEQEMIKLLDHGLDNYPADFDVAGALSDQEGWQDYLDIIENFITLPINSTVLEIAPGNGAYQRLINNSDIKKYIGVEPFTTWYESLKDGTTWNPEVEFHNCTYEKFILDEPVDVVITAGLFYHLASPIHFIETIANDYKPDLLYVESIGHLDINYMHATGKELSYAPEVINKAGNRQQSHGRAVPYNATIDTPTIAHFLECVGYKLIDFDDIETRNSSKVDSCIMKFHRLGDNVWS
tara:strand:+ start:397 stop:1149 length:753 start_codon:yes stop_codon:yes gene_type:complete